ncbi:MAG: hypothetical protein M4579_001660 [Chaenotheca gracillima]|nr:MAG: hypothetical protein M4579_001660 [Chaenotheca gracillima]
MPLRDRMRKAFGRTNSSSDDLTPKRTKSQKAELYKSGDSMPKPKYPGRYNKPHQDMLKSFSFADAWTRRKSEQSSVSPLHSRATSRKSSLAGPSGRKSAAGHRPGSVGQLAENTDSDDDVVNVGLSRQVTRDRNPKMHQKDPELEDSAKAMSEANGSSSNTNTLFSEHELSEALQKTSLQVPGMTGGG